MELRADAPEEPGKEITDFRQLNKLLRALLGS